MNTIKTIKELYSELGEKFYNDLLSSEFTVYEKLDGNYFGVVISSNGDMNFFRKNLNSAIGEVDRTLTTLYEGPINYFNNLPENIKTILPIGYKFSFYYFPNEKPLSIKYDKMPKNNLVLNYIEDDKGNKINDIITLNYYADTLKIERPPIYFKGKLNDVQKDMIFEYLSSDKISNDNKNIISNILKIIVPDIKNTFLKDDLNGNLKNLFFRFDNGNEVKYSKLFNESFNGVIKQDIRDNDDPYYLILSDIIDFIMLQDLEKIRLPKKNYEKRYVALICVLFNRFIDKKGEFYLDFEFFANLDKNQYNNLNLELVKNKETLIIISQSVNYQELFKIMLGSFRKKRKRKHPLMGEKTLKFFNEIVDKITEICSFDPSLNESFITFDEFQRIYIDGEKSKDVVGVDLDVYNRENIQRTSEYRVPTFDVNQFLATCFLDASDIRPRTLNKNKTKLNLIIDTFNPMTNFQYDVCIKSFEKFKTPIYLIVIKSDTPAFANNTLIKILESLKTEEFIEGYMLIDRPLISTIYNHLKEEYNINKLICNSKWSIYMDIQIKTNQLNGNPFNILDTEFPIEYYDEDEAIKLKVKNALESKDYIKFKENVPTQYSNMYNEIIMNLKN